MRCLLRRVAKIPLSTGLSENPGALNPWYLRKLKMPRLFVGNIPFGSTEGDLQSLFLEYGYQLESVEIIRDKFTQQPRGFAFVETVELQDAEGVIAALNGKFMGKRPLTVALATPRVITQDSRRDRNFY